MVRARKVVQAIHDLIQKDGIEPGGRLPTEHELARKFKVSRPIVREAIQALKAMGVVESRPRVGLRVLPFDPGSHVRQMIPRIRTDEERAELYEFRCLLEPAVLRLVARRASRKELDQLEAILSAPVAPGNTPNQESIRRDIAFHEGLWRLARNRFVWSLHELLVRYFADLEERRDVSMAEFRRINRQHLAIVRALKAGNLERSQQALARNLAAFRPVGGDSP